CTLCWPLSTIRLHSIGSPCMTGFSRNESQNRQPDTSAMAQKKTRLQDIAKKLNVSAASVSRALADNPRISLALRKKVQDAAVELGYVPNTAARALRTG